MINLNVEIVPCSARPIRFNAEKCIACNHCVEVCQVDVLLPNPEKDSPPIVCWPGECYYCGSCVAACPVDDAITLTHPLMNQTRFVPLINTENVDT